MEAAATHAGLRGPTRGAVRPRRVLGLAHGVAVETAGAPEGGTGRWQLRAVLGVRPEGQLALAVSVIVFAGESRRQVQGRLWLV